MSFQVRLKHLNPLVLQILTSKVNNCDLGINLVRMRLKKKTEHSHTDTIHTIHYLRQQGVRANATGSERLLTRQGKFSYTRGFS